MIPCTCGAEADIHDAPCPYAATLLNCHEFLLENHLGEHIAARRFKASYGEGKLTRGAWAALWDACLNAWAIEEES